MSHKLIVSIFPQLTVVNTAVQHCDTASMLAQTGVRACACACVCACASSAIAQGLHNVIYRKLCV